MLLILQMRQQNYTKLGNLPKVTQPIPARARTVIKRIHLFRSVLALIHHLSTEAVEFSPLLHKEEG